MNNCKYATNFPWPPTVNTYWRHFSGKHLISKEGRQYRKAVQQQIMTDPSLKGKKLFPLKGSTGLEITAYPPDRRRRDLDNILKSLLDSMVHAGMIEDDSQFDIITIRRGGFLQSNFGPGVESEHEKFMKGKVFIRLNQ